MAILQAIFPYADDPLNLPVSNVDTAVKFYKDIMGFRLVSKVETPHKKVILKRDNQKIGLAENGGDPSQEGCFFEVDNVEEMFAELKANGLNQDQANYRLDQHGDSSYKVFFVVAPDGLCFCLGERCS